MIGTQITLQERSKGRVPLIALTVVLAAVLVACALMLPSAASANPASSLTYVTNAAQAAAERAQVNPQAVAQVAAGSGHYIVIRADGSLWTWGSNANGQLGIGRPMAAGTMNSTPQRVGTDTWQSVAAGGSTVLAVREDGSLWGWGNNEATRKLTSALPPNRFNTPQRIGNDYNWQSVSMSSRHVMAIRTDGGLWGWGYNNHGQLGRGGAFTTFEDTPQRVGTQAWLAVECGANHTLAIRSDGTLWVWGNNGMGQFGHGSFSASNSNPQMTGAATDVWQSISAEDNTNLAIRSDGSLFGWGRNDAGMLGPANLHGNQTTMQRMGAATDYWQSAVVGLGNRVHAVRVDGSLWGWGSNASGRLGLGYAAPWYDPSTPNPQRVGTDNDWHAVFPNTSGSANAIKENGTLWTWGANGSGVPSKGIEPVLGDATMGEGTNNWIPWRVAASPAPTTIHNWTAADSATIPNNDQVWVSPDNTPYVYIFFDRLMSTDPTTWGTISFVSDGPSRTATVSGFVDASFGQRGVNEMYSHEWWFHTGANSEAVRVDMTQGEMVSTVADFNEWGTPFPATFGPMDHWQRGIQSVFRVPLIFGDIPDPELPMTKHLMMPADTPRPIYPSPAGHPSPRTAPISFDFTFTPARITLEEGPPVVQSRPVTDFAGIVDSPQTITMDMSAPTGTDAVAGTVTYSGNLDLWALFRGVESDFPGAGIYVFNVAEVNSSSGTTSPSYVTYSTNRFQLRVSICRDGELYYIAVHPLTGTSPNYVVGPKQETISFTNRYRMHTPGLEIQKYVAGNLADITTPFIFDLQLTANVAAPIPASITAQRFAANGTPSGTVTITNGVATGFTLTHGQWLVVPNLPVGTSFNVTEQNVPASFAPSAHVYIGAPATPAAPIRPLAGSHDWTGSASRGVALSTGSHALTEATGRNLAHFTNTSELPPPDTGLSINDGSALVLVAASLAALTTLVVVKRRKEPKEPPVTLQ
ncbi:MAG: hypothetical protein FWE48_02240 [Coriobacteriia bacterium]|nr:hypothetical protein [Coriobacteriia bacterium]